MSTWPTVVAGMTRASPALRVTSLNLNTFVSAVFKGTVPAISNTLVAGVYPFPEVGSRSVVGLNGLGLAGQGTVGARKGVGRGGQSPASTRAAVHPDFVVP